MDLMHYAQDTNIKLHELYFIEVVNIEKNV